MLLAPCGKCLNKGCGSFHSKCYDYQYFLKENERQKAIQHEYKRLQMEQIRYIENALKRMKNRKRTKN